MSIATTPLTENQPRGHALHSAWAVGPWNLREFALAQNSVAVGQDWSTFDALADAIGLLKQSPLDGPAVLLIASPRPGFFRQAEFDELMLAAPLCKPVLVAGSWCEGELRSGSPPPGVHRVYWHQLPAWWRRSERRIAAGLAPLWSYPPRLMPEEDPATVELDSTVLVSAADHAVHVTLACGLGCFGAEVVRTQPGHAVATDLGPSAGVADAGQLSPSDLDRVRELRGKLPPTAPLTLLLDYPRAEHLDQAAQAGATAVLGKPYRIDDLARSFSLSTML